MDTDKSWDPVTDFKKHIEKVPGIKYEMLPYEEDNTNCLEKLFESGLTNVINPEQYIRLLICHVYRDYHPVQRKMLSKPA